MEIIRNQQLDNGFKWNRESRYKIYPHKFSIYLGFSLFLSWFKRENTGNEIVVSQWKDVISNTTNQKHYPDMGSDEVVTRQKYGMSDVTSAADAKCRLFAQANTKENVWNGAVA